MTNYKNIQGYEVQSLSSDPTEAGWVGSIFYNSTEGVFKTVKPGGASAGTWSSGGNLNSTRSQLQGFGATTDTAVASAGYSPTTPYFLVEQYNGTSWTEVTELNNRHEFSQFGVGTQTAGMVAGGGPGPVTPAGSGIAEEYNGTSWTNGGTMNVPRNDNAGSGTQTAAITVGGRPAASYGPGARNAETYNGTSWTSVSDAPPSTATIGWAMTGVETAAIGAGAAGPSPIFAVYWNGSAWTDITASNSPHYIGGAAGSQTDAIIYGGGVPNSGNTEHWNGTAWTELNNMATARDDFGYNSQNSNGSSACAYGGENDSSIDQNVTEEWTVPEVVINTLTTS